MLLKATIPVDKGNSAIKDGSLPKVIEAAIVQLKPEAVYFTIQDGQRSTFFFFDLQNESDMVTALEPLWMALEADIELVPVMTPDDLRAGMKKAFG